MNNASRDIEAIKSDVGLFVARLRDIEGLFLVWHEINLHRSRGVSKESADIYSKVLSNYAAFFHPVIRSLFATFYIELCSLWGLRVNGANNLLEKDRHERHSLRGLIYKVRDTKIGHDQVSEYLKLQNKYDKEIRLVIQFRNDILAHKGKAWTGRFERVLLNYDDHASMLNDMRAMVGELHDYLVRVSNSLRHEDLADSYAGRQTHQLIDKLRVSHPEAERLFRENREAWYDIGSNQRPIG